MNLRIANEDGMVAWWRREQLHKSSDPSLPPNPYHAYIADRLLFLQVSDIRSHIFPLITVASQSCRGDWIASFSRDHLPSSSVRLLVAVPNGNNICLHPCYIRRVQRLLDLVLSWRCSHPESHATVMRPISVPILL